MDLEGDDEIGRYIEIRNLEIELTAERAKIDRRLNGRPGPDDDGG